jgi:hypothetical protein
MGLVEMLSFLKEIYVRVVFVLSYNVAEQLLDMNTAIRNERFN